MIIMSNSEINLNFQSIKLLYYIKRNPGVSLSEIYKKTNTPIDSCKVLYFQPLCEYNLVSAVLTDDLDDYGIFITDKGLAFLSSKIIRIITAVISIAERLIHLLPLM